MARQLYDPRKAASVGGGVPGKFWLSRNQHQANAPVPEVSFQKLQEMLEQVRDWIANNERSYEDVQKRMANLEQQIVKLDEYAVHARNARQQDLARQVLTQKRECESKLSETKRISQQIADEEQRLNTDRHLLEAKIAVAACPFRGCRVERVMRHATRDA